MTTRITVWTRALPVCLITIMLQIDGEARQSSVETATVAEAVVASHIPGLVEAVSYEVGSTRVVTSSGSFSFRFNPVLGVPERVSTSFGPLFAERPSTIGKGKYAIGWSFENSKYDRWDGYKIREDFKTTRQDITGTSQSRVKLDQTSFVASLSTGLTDRLDLTGFVPFSKVSDVTETRLTPPGANPDNSPITSIQASSFGVGDVAVRAKYSMVDNDEGRLSVLGEMRFPTGDVQNFRGLGRPQFRAGTLFSTDIGRKASIHGNAVAVFMSNDDQRTVGGEVINSDQRELEIVFGMEITPIKRLTVSTDLLYRFLAGYAGKNVTMWSYGAAAKVNVARQLLIGGSFLYALDDVGLRDGIKVALQVEYTF